MRPSFKDYFYFNNTERKGLYILLLLIFLLLTANWLLAYFPADGESTRSESELRELLSDLEIKTAELQKQNHQYSDDEGARHERATIAYFDFNPNNLPVEQWMKLGLSKKQAEVIKKYEAKGGSFKVKADLKKMYTISEEHYRALSPYILLPDSLEKLYAKQTDEKFNKPKHEKWENVVADINISDSATLHKVYGIGPFYSGKIVSYRNELGGYHNKNQLLEIWHFSDSLLQALDSSLLMTKVELKRLNINTSAAKDLKKHPYINWNIANSIVNFRNQHGSYQKIEDIKQSALIDDSVYLKISPYLKVENK